MQAARARASVYLWAYSLTFNVESNLRLPEVHSCNRGEATSDRDGCVCHVGVRRQGKSPTALHVGLPLKKDNKHPHGHCSCVVQVVKEEKIGAHVSVQDGHESFACGGKQGLQCPLPD